MYIVHTYKKFIKLFSALKIVVKDCLNTKICYKFLKHYPSKSLAAYFTGF